MAGAVWLALVLRMDVLKGLSYNVYFEFSSSKSSQEAHGTGWGFGMTNEDNNQPWNPYYVNKMIGSNLYIGDDLVNLINPSNDIRALGWLHDATLNILLICKVDEPRRIYLQGLTGQLTFFKIDNTTSCETPNIQTGIFDCAESFIVYGYTVALVQMRL